MQKGAVKWVVSPVPSTCRDGSVCRDNDVLYDECKLLWFFPQIRLISVIIIAPSSLHWGAVPLLCSHEGTLASLRSCCCFVHLDRKQSTGNVFCDPGGILCGTNPLGRFSFPAEAQLFQGGRKEPRTPPISTWCWSRALSDMPLPPVYTSYVQNIMYTQK